MNDQPPTGLSRAPIGQTLAQTLGRPLWLILPALICAIALGYYVASTSPDFEDFALGDQTVSVFGTYDGDKIFCGSLAESTDCLGPAHARALPRQVLWLGNSQLHAINQSKPDSRTSPVLLAQRLRPQKTEVQAMSFPNASLAELWLAWLYQRTDRHIDVLILPVFLDDTREFGIRDTLRPLTEDVAIAAILDQTPAGQRLLATIPTPAKNVAVSLQERSEAAITKSLEACCGFQTMRERARGQIDIWLFSLRNWLFNITPQSVRPIIPDRYAANLDALEALLADARLVDTKVILYIPPLRQDVAPPYRPEDYARIKTDAARLASQHGAVLLDLDDIVPGNLWGTKAATVLGGEPELDFMHYQAPGHAALATMIAPKVEALLK